MSDLKIGLGLSGGVDSAVSLLLLQKKFKKVNSFYLNCFQNDFCSNNQDRNDAFLIAQKLKSKFKIIDLIKIYQEKVLSYFFTELKKGNTPNPDIICNQEIKFGLFYQYLEKNNFDFIATGHYAQVLKIENNYYLTTGKDLRKDQSYFLCKLKESQLKKIKFPLGHLEKSEVRKIAKQHHLKVAEKKDSMGICFLGNLNFNYLLKNNLGEKKGEIIDKSGNFLGNHNGHWFYTVGQKISNLDFQLLKKSNLFKKIDHNNIPKFYVISKDRVNNKIAIGLKREAEKNNFFIKNIHSIYSNLRITKLDNEINLFVKYRNTGNFIKCKIQKNNKKIKFVLENKKTSLAEGQFAVFYFNTFEFIQKKYSSLNLTQKEINNYKNNYICLGCATIC